MPDGGTSDVKLSLKSLDARLRRIEEELAYLARSRSDSGEEWFNDLLGGVLEALVRARSQGALMYAEALRDKYMPGVPLHEFGEQVVLTGRLWSASKGE